MHSQCPECGKAYPVTKKQQRAKKTQIYCGDCKKKFTVTAFVSEKTAKIAKTAEINPQKFNKPPVPKAEEVKPEITPTLLTEAKTEFIPKEDSRQLVGADKKNVSQLYASNLGNVLKRSNAKTAVIVPQAPPPQERLPWEVDSKQASLNWFLGAVIGLLLLVSQVVAYEVPKLSQSTTYRPLLEKLCQWVGCRLAVYENLSEFAVMKSSFTPQSDQIIVFKTTINNQSAFKQRLPNIQLNLLDYNEQLMVQRVFYPKDYLPNSSSQLTIMPDETVEAMLVIAVPETPVGGYNFNLVY